MNASPAPAQYSRITGTGSYLPPKILTNTELAKQVDTTDEWIVERTGIAQRHIAGPDEKTSDLAFEASCKALQAAGMDGADLDLIIVATTTPDYVFPSVATQLQERLSAYGCAAFDMQAVCSGFVYGLGIADNFVRAGAAKRVLVVGAETFSRILDWNDRTTCVLFGDGAGAVVLEAQAQPGIMSTHLHADGRHREMLWVPSGVSNGYDRMREEAAFVKMRGRDVFKFAVTTLSRLVEETLSANQMTPADVDWLVPHQANERIIAATAKKLGFDPARVVCTVMNHANTSAASVPLALDVAVRDGRIKTGQTVLLEAFGGGFTWASALLRY